MKMLNILVNNVIISVWPTQPFGPRPPLGGKKYIPKGTASNGYEAKFEHSY